MMRFQARRFPFFFSAQSFAWSDILTTNKGNASLSWKQVEV